MLSAVIQSLPLVLGFLYLTVMVQKVLGKTLVSEDPTDVSGFLSSLAQFAAIPITIAFSVIVLIIERQANAFSVGLVPWWSAPQGSFWRIASQAPFTLF